MSGFSVLLKSLFLTFLYKFCTGLLTAIVNDLKDGKLDGVDDQGNPCYNELSTKK
jgi:hypothetical protein